MKPIKTMWLGSTFDPLLVYKYTLSVLPQGAGTRRAGWARDKHVRTATLDLLRKTPLDD